MDGSFSLAHKNGTTLKEESIKSGLITEEEYKKIFPEDKLILNSNNSLKCTTKYLPCLCSI